MFGWLNEIDVFDEFGKFDGGETIQQYKVGIYDDDKAYMMSLMNHINSDRGNPFLALAFSGRDELQGYLRANSLDILLIDEKLYVDIWQELRGQRCVVLSGKRPAGTDSGSEISKYGEGWFGGSVESGSLEYGEQSGGGNVPGVLFKYSKARDIVRAVMKYMDADVPERRRKLFRSYGVISPVGRCGKTKLAINLCMNDEIRGGLYIGLEEFSSFEDREDVVSNVIYLIKERSDGFTDYVGENTVQLDDYSVLGYMRSYLDAMELDRSDVEWMLEQLRVWGRYTTIVLDIGQAVLKDLSVLSALDVIVVPELPDEQSQEKIRTFERLLESEELGKVAKRMKRVRVPDAAPGSAEMMRFIESQVMDKW